jgi:hypothetical protein
VSRSRNRRKSPAQQEAEQTVSHSVPAFIALAAFRAALAADTKANNSDATLDECTSDYLGKITQSVLKCNPRCEQLSEALGPILMAHSWEATRVQQFCNTIWTASQKAAARPEVQAHAAQDLKAQTSAFSEAKKVLAEHVANELATEEDKAEERTRRKAQRSEKRELQVRQKLRAELVENRDGQSTSSCSNSVASSEDDQPQYNDEVHAETESHNVDAHEPTDDHSSGLTWIVENHSFGVETVFECKESADGRMSDLKILNRSTDVSSKTSRPASKRMSPSSNQGSSAQKSLTYSADTSQEFLSFSMSDDASVSRRGWEDSFSSTSIHDAVASDLALVAEDDSQDASTTTAPDEDLMDDGENNISIKASDSLGKCKPQDDSASESVHFLLTDISQQWPCRVHPPLEPELISQGRVPQLPGRGTPQSVSMPTSCPSSAFDAQSASASDAMNASGSDVCQSEQDVCNADPLVRQVSGKTQWTSTPGSPLKSPWTSTRLWPSTPDASPFCNFVLPPPLPPWQSLEPLAPGAAGAFGDPAMDAQHPFRQLLQSNAGPGAAVKSACASQGEEAEHQEQHIDACGRQIIYVPVMMPHRCSHCGHECRGGGQIFVPAGPPLSGADLEAVRESS